MSHIAHILIAICLLLATFANAYDNTVILSRNTVNKEDYVGKNLVFGQGTGTVADFYKDAIYSYSLVQSSIEIFYDVQDDADALRDLFHLNSHFACVDVLIDDADYDAFKDVQMFPTVAITIVPIVNIDGVAQEDEFVLKGDVLAKIFTGEIRNWNDTKIREINPEINMPNVTINSFVPQGWSILTEVFQLSLKAFYPDIETMHDASGLGTGIATFDGDANWPYSHNAIPEEFVVPKVTVTPNSISYSTLTRAMKFGVVYTQMFNKYGSIVKPSFDNVATAVSDVGTNFEINGYDKDRLNAIVYDSGAVSAWPVAFYTYLVFRTNPFYWAKYAPPKGVGARELLISCEERKAQVGFWKWFFQSTILIPALSQQYGYVPNDQTVADLILTKLLGEVFCDDLNTLADDRMNDIILRGYSLPIFINIFKLFESGYQAQQGKIITFEFTSIEQPEYNAPDTEAAYVVTPVGNNQDLKHAQFPWGFFPIVVIFNIPEWEAVPEKTHDYLMLDLRIIQEIFLGNITHWSDNRLFLDNPELQTAIEGLTSEEVLIKKAIRQDSTYTNVWFKTGLPDVPNARSVEWKTSASDLTYLKPNSEEQMEAIVMETPMSIGYKVGIFDTSASIIHIRRKFEDVNYYLSPYNVTHLQACGSDTLDGVFGESHYQFFMKKSQNPWCYPFTEGLYLRLLQDFDGGGQQCRNEVYQVAQLIKYFVSEDTDFIQQMVKSNIAPLWSDVYGAMSKGVDTITCNQAQSLLWNPNDICESDDWVFVETPCENARREISHQWKEPKTCRLGLSLPGEQVVACDNIKSHGLMAFTFIGWFATVAVVIFIIINRQHPVIIRTLSLPQAVVLLGIFLQFSSPWLENNLENDKLCLAAPVVNMLAGFLILGGLAHATHQAKKPLVFISNFKYVQTHFTGGCVVAFFLVLWCTSKPPKAGFIKKHFIHGTYTEFHNCVTDRIFHVLASIMLSCTSLFLTYLSFSARNQEGSLKSALLTFHANVSFLLRTILRFYFDQVPYGDQFDPESKYVLDALIDFFFVSLILVSYWLPRCKAILNDSNEGSTFGNSFVQQLDDPVSRHFITKLAESMNNEVSRGVNFYSDVMSYKNMCRQKKSNDPAIKAKAHEIFNLYIKAGAPRAIETSEMNRERCGNLLKFEKDKSVVFDQNLNNIRSDLDKQLARKFMASSFLDNSQNVSRWCDEFIGTYDSQLKKAVLEKFNDWIPKSTGVKVTKVNEMKEHRRRQKERLVALLRIKLLVLGASNSGKSTFCRILENPEVDGEVLSDRMLKTVSGTLQDNVIDATLRLINGVEFEKKSREETLSEELKAIKSRFMKSRVLGSRLTPELAEIASNILSDPYIQYALHAGHIYVQQKTEYYLEHAERFASKNYIPNRTDLAYMYLESVFDTYELSRFENMLNEEVTYVLTDMVGSKGMRYRWRTEFEGSKGVIFCVNLSGIGRRSEEDVNLTELEESLNLFQMVVHDECFTNAPFFVVFTKKDAYDYWAAQEERSIDDVRAVFPDYENPEGVSEDTIDALHVQEYIEQVFVCESPNPENVTPLYVTSTNERSVHSVFDRIRQTVMSVNASKMAPRIKNLSDSILSGFVSEEIDM